MHCVVAKPRLVASPESWFSDFLFPLHQSDPFINNMPTMGSEPVTWRLSVSSPTSESGRQHRLKDFSSFLAQIYTFKTPISPYSFTHFTKSAGTLSLLHQQQPVFPVFFWSVNHYFLDHEMLFTECSGEHGCELDLWPCGGPIWGEILITYKFLSRYINIHGHELWKPTRSAFLCQDGY